MLNRLSLVLLLAACQPKAEALDLAIESGDAVPTRTLTAAELNDAPRLELDHEVEIPGDSTATLLTRVDGLVINDAGEVTLADPQTHVVRVFSRDGKVLRRFGGRGDGPGELRRPFLITSRADTLFVVDENGINMFTLDGRYLDRTPIAMITNRQGRSYAQHFPRTIAATGSRLVISDVPPSMQGHDTTYQETYSLRQVDPQTGVISEAFQQILSEKYYPRGISARWRARFGVERQFGLMPDGAVIVNGFEGRTLNVYVDGRQTARVVFDAPRREVTNRELDALTDQRTRVLKEHMATTEISYPPGYLQKSIKHTKRLPYFRYHPAVGRILVSTDGHVLVHRPDLSEGTFDWDALWGPTVWNVLTNDLRVVGRIELPAGFTPVAFNGSMIAGTTRDSLDVPSVSAYRVRGGVH